MHKREYAIYVIKPDGVKKQIQEVVHSFISAHNYTLEEERTFRIPAEKVSMLFNTGFDNEAYAEYMTEGAVIAGVCSGINTCQALNEMKYHIRTEYNCAKNMRNLIHSCEPGLETMREFDFFYPEWRQRGWKPTADMYIPINRSNYEQIIEQIATATNLEYAGLILMGKNLKLREESFDNVQILYGVQILSQYRQWSIPLLVYFQHGEQAIQASELTGKPLEIIIDQVRKNNGIIASGFFSYDTFYKEMVTCIDGIDTIYLFDPRYSYDELNTVEHWSVVMKNMAYLGGSYGLLPLGEFGISASAVSCVIERLGKEPKSENHSEGKSFPHK